MVEVDYPTIGIMLSILGLLSWQNRFMFTKLKDKIDDETKKGDEAHKKLGKKITKLQRCVTRLEK